MVLESTNTIDKSGEKPCLPTARVANQHINHMIPHPDINASTCESVIRNFRNRLDLVISENRRHPCIFRCTRQFTGNI